jgi:hypothetical protein
MNLWIENLGVRLPVYATLADFSVQFSTDPDTLVLHHLQGTIGSSHLELSGRVIDYASLLNSDTVHSVKLPPDEQIKLDFTLAGDSLRAKDLFTFRQQFLLPEEYQSEVLEKLRFSGDLSLPVEQLTGDTLFSEFGLNVLELSWKLGSYPLPFHQFMASVSRKGDQLYIDEFQGKVGESEVRLNARLENFADTLLTRLYGEVNLESKLLDINEITRFPLPGMKNDTAGNTRGEEGAPVNLNQFDYPNLELTLNIGELRFSDYILKGFHGKLRTSKEKIFYLDQLYTALDRGGSFEFSGQFNASDPGSYSFSTNFDVNDIDVNSLDMEMNMGEEIYTLRENFRGLVSADGLAEVYLTPELSLDLPSATAVFNVKVVNGELINFTPLQAAAKFLDNKDLNHVRFATLENSFPLTLSEGKITVPLTIVESTIGQMLIEGEQGLGGDYLYLLRLPTWLVRGAARSRLTVAGDDQKEDQIQEYRSGNFLNMTVWGEGDQSEVKMGDRRTRYR